MSKKAETDLIVVEQLPVIKDSLLAKDYAVQLAGRLRLREQDVLDELARTRAPRKYRGDDERLPETPNNGQANQASAEPVAISQTEQNRRRVERELLSLSSQYPALAIKHSDALAQTNWHETIHAELAAVILGKLASDAMPSAAEIVTAATAAAPRAAGILTAANARDEQSAERTMEYLAQDLAIGDMEQTVAALKASLAAAEDGDPNEYELLFQSIVELQRDISAKKAAHKPIM